VLGAQNVGLPIALIPAVLVVMNVVYALAAYPAGALSDHLGRFAVLFFGLMTLIVADLVLAAAPSVIGEAIGVALCGAHMGLTQSALASLVADTSPPELRGSAFGYFNLLGGAAALAASVIAGALWDRIGPPATFLASAVFAFFTLLGLIWLRTRLSGNDPAD